MFQLSHFKLLAGVFFALFVLTACGGGGDAAAPAEAAATDTSNDSGTGGDGAVTKVTCEADGKYWTGTACVDKVESCTDDTKPYLDVANNECIAYTEATCPASKFWNSTACVARLTVGDCTDANHNGVNQATNECAAFTQATCPDTNYWNVTNETCVAKVTSCTNQYLDVANNECIAYTQATCPTDSKFWDTSANDCVDKVTSCSDQYLDEASNTCIAYKSCGNQYLNVDNNTCIAYTETTCLADGKFWGSSCEVKLTDSDCDASFNGVDADNNTCLAYESNTCIADGKFWTGSACEAIATCTVQQTYDGDDNTCPLNPELFRDYAKVAFNASSTEYTNNSVLALINANTAYAGTDGTNTDGYTGLGQTIAVLGSYINNSGYNPAYVGLQDITAANPGARSDNRTPDNTSDDFNVDNVANPLFVTGYNNVNTNNTVLEGGSCGGSSACRNTENTKKNNHNLNHLAGRRDGATGTTGIHGVAYDANIKVNNSANAEFHLVDGDGNQVSYDAAALATLTATIEAGGGTDIAAMVQNVDNSAFRGRVPGQADGTSNLYAAPRLELHPDLKASYMQVADTTVLVSHTGNTSFSSFGTHVGDTAEYYPDFVTFFQDDNVNYDDPDNLVAITDPAHADYVTDPKKATEKANVAIYQNDIVDFAGSWIVATAVDANNVIIGAVATGSGIYSSVTSYGANGCGGAKQYCLAVPFIETLDNDGTTMRTAEVQYTLGGAIAVIREAFPNLSVKQTVAVTLGTATYIDANNDGDETNDADYGLVDDTTGKYNAVYGHGLLNLGAAVTLSAADALAANIVANSVNGGSIGALWSDTQLTLSSHFGSNFDSIDLGVQDQYGRYFTLETQKHTSAPVAVASFDEYMGNMLADTVQSQKLGGQAKLNYSNNGQPWMDLEYKAGKATSKIAFQDNYKVKPLHNNSAASILRANNIRPASNNIGMMDIDYALNGNLSLSSYAARGEYDTGYKFDELGTDFDVNYKKSHLNIAIGNIREHDQFLGTHTTGGYALNAPTVSRFTDVTYGHDLGKTDRFNIYANYINYETDVDMLYDQFASIDNLQADQYQVGFTGKSLISDDDSLNVALITKLGVTDGALNQNTTLGYTADGGFNDVSQSYDLAVSERHQQFEITYQGKIYQNSQDEVSVLKDNRFFTTIRVDQNLNHVQGASQTEVISGINARF